MLFVREERRQILLNNNSSYDLDGIEKATRVSFFDIHEREKHQKGSYERPKGYGKQKIAEGAEMVNEGRRRCW